MLVMRVCSLDSSAFYCCFDDELSNPCKMTPDQNVSNGQEVWTLTDAASSFIAGVDNTMNLGMGAQHSSTTKTFFSHLLL